MPARVGNPARRRRHFIREWREFRGMTQEELAEAIGTTKTSISRLEALKQGYTQDMLEAIAEALGVHTGVLLTRPPNDTDRLAVAMVQGPRPAKRRRA